MKQIKVENPSAKVALISFDSSGYYYGDGKVKERTIKKEDFLNSHQNELNKIRADAQKLDNIEKSVDDLEKRINNLVVGGGSSIFSALAHSIVLASAFENSQILIFTDGVLESPERKYVDSINSQLRNLANCKIHTNLFGNFESSINQDFLRSLGRLQEVNDEDDLNDIFTLRHNFEHEDESNNESEDKIDETELSNDEIDELIQDDGDEDDEPINEPIDLTGGDKKWKKNSFLKKFILFLPFLLTVKTR